MRMKRIGNLKKDKESKKKGRGNEVYNFYIRDRWKGRMYEYGNGEFMYYFFKYNILL